MNLRMIFAACAIAAFGSSMMTSDALAQKQSFKEQLVGTWTLLSWEQKKGDGTKLERYGTSPKGIAFFDRWAIHYHRDAIRSHQLCEQCPMAWHPRRKQRNGRWHDNLLWNVFDKRGR